MTYKHEVCFLGRISEEELGKLYGSAEALMYVSVFEGFGVPILEGFTSGLPVITSNTSSMPEIAQGAALCVNPFNPHDIAIAMGKLAEDKPLREELIRLGKERSTDFSWDKTADLLWQSIEKAGKDLSWEDKPL